MSFVTQLTTVFQRIRDEFNTLRNEIAGLNHRSLIVASGRFYLQTAKNWVTDSDDNYGPAYYQWAESGGTGANPIAEWEHLGHLIPAGRRIKKFLIAGRVNNTEVTDIEIVLLLRRPNPVSRWETGLDNDGEDVETLLYRNMFFSPDDGGVVFSGNINDVHKREILLDQLVEEDSYLSIYVRPVSLLPVLAARRYFVNTYTWEIE